MVTPSSRGGPWGARNHVAKAGLGKGHVGGHSRVGGKTVLNNRHRKIARDTILGITRPDIKRLARRGGVKRISMGIYEEIRAALKDRLETILRTCVIFVEHRNAKTITTTDVIYSLRRIGRPIYGFDPDTYDGKKKPQHAGAAD